MPTTSVADSMADIIYVAISIFSGIVNLAIIFILSRYKNLRKPVNMFIVNWIISDTFIAVANVHIYKLSEINDHDIDLPSYNSYMCIFGLSCDTFRTAGIIFVSVLQVNWFVTRFFKNDFLERYYIRVLLLVWTLTITVHIALIFTTCNSNEEDLVPLEHLYILTYIALIICLGVTHCLRRCANPFDDPDSIVVALSTAYFLFWAARIVYCGLVLMGVATLSFDRNLTSDLTECVGNLYPVAMFYLYYRLDKNFNQCVTRIVRKVQGVDDGSTCFEEMEQEE